MTIGIDAHNLEGNRTGVGRYLFNLLKIWSQSDFRDFYHTSEHRKNFSLKFILYFKDEIPEDLPKSDLFEEKLLNAKTIIIATGTEWKKLEIPGEEKFSGKGVHYCTICDGSLYKDKIIAVVGGSDSAVKEAIYLSEYGNKVYLIHRKERIKAEPFNREKLHLNKKIEVIYNTNIKEIKGDKFVNAIILDKEYNGSNELKIDGLFINVGNVPITELTKKTGIHLNEKEEIIIDKESKTNIKGVFAAGDVTNKKFKQVISAASEGAMAAYSSYVYLQEFR